MYPVENMAINDGTFHESPYRTGINGTIDFMNVFSLLLRNAVLIIGVGILCAILAYGASFLIPNYYTATTQILLDPEGSRIMESDIANPSRVVDAHAINQQYIITSTQVLSRVIESEKLYDDPKFGAAPPVYADRERRTKQALDALRQVVTVSRSGESFVVDLTVKSENGEKASRLANLIASSYTDVRSEMNSGLMRRASDGLAAQLETLKKAVEDGDRNVQSYKGANNLADVAGRPAIEQQITEANTEISKLSSTIAENEAMVADLARARSDREYLRSVPDIYLTQAIITLRARYHESVEQEAVLAASLGARHPSLQAARSRTRSISGILDEQLRNFTTSASRNLEKLKNQLTILRGNAHTLKGRLNSDEQSMVRLRELERKLESDRLVYESFLLRTRQLSEQERTSSENPQVISIAEPPLRKAGPPRSIIGAVGGVFGLTLGMALVLLRDQIGGRRDRTMEPAATAREKRGDNRMYREMEREGKSRDEKTRPRRPAIRGRGSNPDNRGNDIRDNDGEGTPRGLMAALRSKFSKPGRNELNDDHAHTHNRKHNRDNPYAPAARLSYKDSDPDTRDIRHSDDGATNGSYVNALLAQEKEGYAAFARSVAASCPPGTNHCILLVAAGQKNRTPYVAFNLAAAAARQGRQVLLIDAATHNPALTASLALSQHAGLSDIIADRHFEETSLVKFEVIPHLWFMPAGTLMQGQGKRRNTPEEVLTDWLNDDDQMFDLVVIDGGTAADFSIPAEVERSVDNVLLVRHESDAGGAGVALAMLEDRGMGAVRIVNMSRSGFSVGFGN